MWAALAITVTAFTAPMAAPEAETVCRAPPAAVGEAVRGPVLHIPSADQICIARGADPSTWVPVRLSAPAPSRGSLMSAAFGENAVCLVGPNGRAACSVAGDGLEARLQRSSPIIAASWR